MSVHGSEMDVDVESRARATLVDTSHEVVSDAEGRVAGSGRSEGSFSPVGSAPASPLLLVRSPSRSPSTRSSRTSTVPSHSPPEASDIQGSTARRRVIRLRCRRRGTRWHLLRSPSPGGLDGGYPHNNSPVSRPPSPEYTTFRSARRPVHNLLRMGDRVRAGRSGREVNSFPYPRVYRRTSGEAVLDRVAGLCAQFRPVSTVTICEDGEDYIMPVLHDSLVATFIATDARRQRQVDRQYEVPFYAPPASFIDSSTFRDPCPFFRLAPLNPVTFDQDSQSPFEMRPVSYLSMSVIEELARIQVHLVSPMRHLVQSVGDALHAAGNDRLSEVFNMLDHLTGRMAYAAIDTVQQIVYMRRRATHHNASRAQMQEALRQPIWGQRELFQFVREYQQ